MAPSWNVVGGTRHYQEEPCDCRPHASATWDEPETTETLFRVCPPVSARETRNGVSRTAFPNRVWERENQHPTRFTLGTCDKREKDRPVTPSTDPLPCSFPCACC